MTQNKDQTVKCMDCGDPAIHYMVVDNGYPNKNPLCDYCTQAYEYDTQCVYEHEMEVFGGCWGLPSPSYYEPLPEQKEDFDEDETHTTRDGTKIFIRDMEDKHLINSIRLIKKAAQRGVLVEVCGESWGEPFYGMEVIYGQEAEEHLNLSSRNSTSKRHCVALDVWWWRDSEPPS